MAHQTPLPAPPVVVGGVVSQERAPGFEEKEDEWGKISPDDVIKRLEMAEEEEGKKQACVERCLSM